MQHKKSHRPAPHDGYLLVTVVVMLAIAVLMLAKLSRTSMNEATIAMQQERAMRGRWAVTSLRRYCLEQAERLFDAQASGARPILWRKIELGGQTYRVIVADESAKLHLGHLVDQRSPLDAEQTAQNLLPVRSRLRFAAESPDSKRWTPWVAGQESKNRIDARELAEATQRLTLWGNGRVNVLRCDDDVLNELWRNLFGQSAPARLGELRKQRPPPSVAGLIAALGLRESQAAKATSWLTDDSDCFSVWMFCESDRRFSPAQFVQYGSESRYAEHRGYVY